MPQFDKKYIITIPITIGTKNKIQIVSKKINHHKSIMRKDKQLPGMMQILPIMM